MGLLRSKKKINVAQNLFRDDPDYGGDSFLGGLFNSNAASKGRLLRQYTELAYACINVISEEIGKYEPYFYKLEDGQEIIDPRHPMLALLDNPNPNMTRFEFFETTQTHIEIFGEAFWLVSFGKQRHEPMRLDFIRPDRVEIAVQDKLDKSGRYMIGDVIGYKVTVPGGSPIALDPEEVIHTKTVNPFNPYRGYSTIEAGLTSIGIDTSTSEFQKRFMDNNATPQSIVSFKGNIGKDAFDKVKKVFSERHAGVANAGKTLFIKDTDVDVKQLGLSLADLDLKELKTITSERVRGMFRVPMPLLGSTSGVGLGRAGVETEEYIFQKYPIEAKKIRLDDQLKLACKAYWPQDQEIRVGHQTAIPEDGDLRLKEDNELTGKLVTINEGRKRRGLLPVVGGDELYVSFNVVRVGKEDENPNDDKEDRPPSKEPVEGEDDQNEDLPEQFKMIKRTLKVKASPEDNLFNLLGTIEDKGLEEYKTKISALISRQKARVLERYDLFTGKALEDQIAPNEDDESELFSAALIFLMYKYLERGGSVALSFVDSNLEFLIDQATKDAIEQYTRTLMRSFNEQTVVALKESVSAGIQNSESRKQMLERISKVYDEALGFRAERIARTEIHNIVNEGMALGYKQAGIKYIKWHTEPGACEFCQPMSGKIVEIGQPFVVAGYTLIGTNGGTMNANFGDIKYANLHSNCRCMLIPVTDKIASLEPALIPIVHDDDLLRQALLEGDN